jgi:hypothetical protein
MQPGLTDYDNHVSRAHVFQRALSNVVVSPKQKEVDALFSKLKEVEQQRDELQQKLIKAEQHINIITNTYEHAYQQMMPIIHEVQGLRQHNADLHSSNSALQNDLNNLRARSMYYYSNNNYESYSTPPNTPLSHNNESEGFTNALQAANNTKTNAYNNTNDNDNSNDDDPPTVDLRMPVEYTASHSCSCSAAASSSSSIQIAVPVNPFTTVLNAFNLSASNQSL